MKYDVTVSAIIEIPDNTDEDELEDILFDKMRDDPPSLTLIAYTEVQ